MFITNQGNKMKYLQKNLFVAFISLCLFISLNAIADNEVNKVSNIDNEKLEQLIKEGALIVDIRREDEWKDTGIIEGSKTITFFDERGRVNPNFVPEFSAVAKKDQPVVLICRSGARTNVASKAIAEQLGYKKVINVTHGILSWIGENKPVSQYSK